MFSSYLSATRHPWPCLWFLLPLLTAYECGVLWLGGSQPEALRNGADAWLHWLLEALGLQELYWAPLLLVAVLLGWSWWRREDRPKDVVGVCSGMALESLLCALGLWGLSRGLGAVLDSLGIVLEVGAPPAREEALGQLITYVGAGIYEEVLFRLVLFWGLVRLLRHLELPPNAVLGPAIVLAALAFALAHHVGPYGEPFDGQVFLFRTLAGGYFTLLFLWRGFGIAVGTHALYDVLVGVSVA